MASVDGAPTVSLSAAQQTVISAIDGPDGTVTLTWSDPQGGNTENLQVNWPTAEYVTEPGPQTVNATVSDSLGDTPASATADNAVAAAPNPVVVKTGPLTASSGGSVTYDIDASNAQTNPATGQGNLELTNAIVSDVLPAGVTDITCDGGAPSPSGSPCSYDVSDRTIEFPAIAAFSDQNPVYTVTYTLPALSGTSDQNEQDTAMVSGIPLGGSSPVSASDLVTTSETPGAGSASAAIDKYGPAEVTPGSRCAISARRRRL
jgi:hypothetical protein